MNVEVSIGEIVDKYTILTIKKIKMSNDNVIKEWDYIRNVLELNLSQVLDDVLTLDLYKVNENLWDVEDGIRDCERNGEFNGEFIELARSVYKLNDHRASIKKEINIKYGSNFIEEKSYQKY